ncbi:glycosyltransferase family 87 protein [Frigoriglobus tundricola]|nr:glycosyltransferase family 87 protein [Frigoriglobus tundricola]
MLSFPRSAADRFRAAHAADPRRLRLAFFALLAVIVVLMSVKYAAKISKPGDSGQQSRSAFLRWRELINGVFRGENIYVGVNEYPNPPIMAVLLRPFAALPPVAGALAWFYAKVLLAVLAAVWVFRLVGARRPPPPAPLPEGKGGNDLRNSDPFAESEEASRFGAPFPSGRGAGGGGLRLDLAKAAAIVLCLPPLLGDLSHNNVNIFILFLVVGCLEAFRRRLDTLAGLTLALAVACKVTPLLFVAYFAWKRCWRVLGATLVGLALWLAVVPGLTFGWDRTRDLMAGWYALMVERPLLKGEVTTEHPNQAVTGFVYRLFTHSPSYIVYPDNIPTPAEYHNLIDIGRPAAWAIVKALTAAFALAVVVLCRWPVRRPTDARQGWVFAAECGFICLGMLLFSERTWKHHAVVLLLPLAVLTYAVAVVELPRRVRRFALGALVASFLLTAVPGLFAGRAADLAMVYGTHTLAFALQTVAVGLLLACRSGGVGGIFEPGREPNLR